MKFTVVWKPQALARLASFWNDAANRQAITAAANEIDRLLSVDPQTRGESRFDTVRVLIVSPLVVAFEVQEPDRLVTVLSVRLYSQRPPGS